MAVAPQTRSEKKAATRQRVLDAAIAIALSEGFGNVTVGAVARRAGLTTGAIYSNFASKEELLLEVVGLVTPALNLTQMLREVADLDGLLDALAAELPRLAKRDAKQVALAAEFQALALRDTKLRKALAATRAAFLDDANDPVSAWIRDHGIAAPLEWQTWETVVNAVATGLIFARLLDGPEVVTDAAIAWVLHRLGGK